MLDLIKRAAELGVFLYLEDSQLKYKLSSDEFPAELKNAILQNKESLIEFLGRVETGNNIILPTDRKSVM